MVSPRRQSKSFSVGRYNKCAYRESAHDSTGDERPHILGDGHDDTTNDPDPARQDLRGYREDSEGLTGSTL